jgi:isopentenyl-diphosphate delta-isomerase
VERFRQSGDAGVQVAQSFAGWGIPTAECVINIRAALPEIALIASGGIRTGLDVAKAIALGADLAATARPALVAAVDERGTEAVVECLEIALRELRIAMFCASCGNLAALRGLSLA